MEALAALDLASPFVSVTVDSGRINATLQALVSGLAEAMRGVKRLDGVAAEHGRLVDTLQGGFNTHTQRLAELTEAVNSLKDVESRMATVERNIEGRFAVVSTEIKSANERTDAVGARVTALEQRSAEANRKMEEALRDAAALAEKAEAAAKASDSKLAVLKEAAEAAEKRAADADAKASLIAATFDMDLAKARGVIDRAARTGDAPDPGSNGLPPRVAFCRALPAFASLEADLRRNVLEEAATLKAHLNEKLDAKIFYRAEQKIDDCLAAAKSNAVAIERLATNLDTRVTTAAFEEAIAKLRAAKADRSELVGMATHEDLRVISDATKETRAYVERALADLQLENREQRARDAAAAQQSAASAGGKAANAAATQDLLERVQALERHTQSLEERKADRKELRALQDYIENTLSNLERRPRSARAGTPQDPLTSTPRRRVPSPIARPGSASIPDRGNSTPPPLYYTTLPVPRGDDHNNTSGNTTEHRVGASTNVFDANGHRTSALLSQGRPVPAEEHFENMRRVAAGETEVPPGYVVHDVRDLERPRSAPPTVADE